jgi:Helix-turn-helix domain
MHQVHNLNRDGFTGDVMLSHDATAALMGVHYRTLYRMRRVGMGPVFKRDGRHILYSRAAVLAYIASCTVTVSSRGGASHTA